MLYKDDWEKAKQRFRALWENEVVDRCCISVIAPRKKNHYIDDVKPDNPEDLQKYYMDKELLLKRNINKFENTYYGGEGFPCIFPDFGTSGHAKYFSGSKYHFAKDTIWFEPILNDLRTESLHYQSKSNILTNEKETLKFLAKEGNDKFLVSMPDNCGVIDALAHLRGTDKLLIDLLDEPEAVKISIGEILNGLIDSSKGLLEIIRENNEGGSSHGWMHTWSERKHMQLQVDFSVMISPKMFEEFALPELEAMTEWLDHSIYHLDGQEEIRHLDMILAIKKLNMIQWTPVSGQPITSEFIHIFKKIQKAGKGLILMPNKSEIEKLLSELSPNGLYLIINDANSELEAKDIIRKVTNLTPGAR